MKLLFTQSLQLFSEKSGMVFFALDKMNNSNEVASSEMEKKKLKKDTREGLSDVVEDVNESLENEKLFKETIEKGNKLLDKITSTIKRELPESEARQMTPQVYGSRIEDIGKRFSVEVSDYQKDLKLVPDGYMTNLKIGGIVGVVAGISTQGGLKDRLKNAAVWGAGAAALAHPALTRGLAKLLSFTGKEVLAPGFVGVTNTVIELIDNPMGVLDAMKNSNLSRQSISDTPIYQLLRHGKTASENFGKEVGIGTQNAFELRAKGLVIGDENLSHVMDAIDLAEMNKKNGVPANFDKTAIPAAATFIMQAAAHKMGEQEMAAFRLKIWNKEASPAQIRQVLVNNAERDILKFFEKNGLMDELTKEMGKQKLVATQSGIAPEKLDLAKAFLDGTAKDGAEGFNLEGRKHGIRRFLSMGAGGMTLALYVMSFLAISGVMKLRKLVHPDTYTKTIPKMAAAPFKWTARRWEGFKKMFKKAPVKALAEIANEKKNKWMTPEQKKALKKLSKKDRKSVGKKLDEWAKNKDKLLKEKKKELKNLKGKEKKDRKKEIPEEVEMKKEEFWLMFSGVSMEAKKALDI